MITTTELKNYAFTIQIPSFKNIQYKNIKQPYGKLQKIEQEDYIYTMVRNVLKDETNHFEIKFEEHKDKRMHAHGTVYQISQEQLNDFKESICYNIGVKSDKQKNECCFCIPILFSYGWNQYIEKGQIKEEDVDITVKDFSKYLFGKLIKKI